jgi:integrase
MGSVRKQGRRPNTWQLDYPGPNGRVRATIRVSSKAEAERVLKQREGDIARGRPLFTSADKVTFEELTALVVRDYELNGKRSVGKTKKNVERLQEFFGGWRAVNVTATAVGMYVEKRLKVGLSNASVNRELATLKRTFHLAVKVRLLSHDHVPTIDLLKEAPPRSGFFEPEQFQAVLRHLRPEIVPVARFGYETGWRLREILQLEWRQLNLDEGWARLDPGTTKNGEGRVVYFSPELLAVLRNQRAATREIERAKGIVTPYVFHRKGRRILRFLASWQTACRAAGLPGRLFHDLRRTAIRNMVKAGVPERVAMMISGHRTRSVFERYAIVNEGDLREAAGRIGNAHARNGQDHESRQTSFLLQSRPSKNPTHGAIDP